MRFKLEAWHLRIMSLVLASAGLCFLMSGCERTMKDNTAYDFEMKEGPTCQVYVDLQTPREVEVYAELLKKFAAGHAIPESTARIVSPPASPHLKRIPMYQNRDWLISSMAIVAEEGSYAQSRLTVLRRDFPSDDFKRLAETFADGFREVFTNRVRIDL